MNDPTEPPRTLAILMVVAALLVGIFILASPSGLGPLTGWIVTGFLAGAAAAEYWEARGERNSEDGDQR